MSTAPPALEARLSTSIGHAPDHFEVESSLTLTDGVMILFGPSGAGKSLTLQTLAGLFRPRAGFLRVRGEVLYDSERRIDVPPHKRRIGFVPQHHALFPFRDVLDNVLFGLPRAERRRDNPRVLALVEELGLERLTGARPARLSGGERQRVALARALAVEPQLLLLDEPFASIDREGRAALRQSLRAVLDHHALPAVFVTHDAGEAIELGDILVRFERGRTVASGVPAEMLTEQPAITVAGRPSGPAERLDDGRMRVALDQATIEGPAAMVEPNTNGTLRLDLRARRRRRTSE